MGQNESGTSLKFKAMKITHSVRQLTLNCNDESITLGSGAVYYTDGSNTSLSAKYAADAAMPDTVGGNLVEIICKEIPASLQKNNK